MTGRTVIVTGGTRGIGLALAEGFVLAGARVVVASRKADACEQAARICANSAARRSAYPPTSATSATSRPSYRRLLTSSAASMWWSTMPPMRWPNLSAR